MIFASFSPPGIGGKVLWRCCPIGKHGQGAARGLTATQIFHNEGLSGACSARF
jgi:hypothetical protein